MNEQLNSCPRCGSNDVDFYKFTQYRPKEFVVKCAGCGFSVHGKGSHFHVLIRKWNQETQLIKGFNK